MTPVMVDRKAEKIKIKQINMSQIWLYGVYVVLAIATIYGFLTIDTKGIGMVQAAVRTVEYFGLMFGSPRAVPSHFAVTNNCQIATFFSALNLVLRTLALAFLTTLIGGVVALVLGLFAARNLTNERLSNVIKGFVAFIRAVPTVLWVLIFAIGAGLGAVAAVIGMSFHTIGYLLKAYSESFEELDASAIEALRASGASWSHIVFQAVIPSSITQLLSWTFIRLEINFAVAVAMGAAAGAGGIGYNMFIAASYFFDIREIGYITIMILAIALVMEIFATKLKKKYHLHS